jgi:hypothetical protein
MGNENHGKMIAILCILFVAVLSAPWIITHFQEVGERKRWWHEAVKHKEHIKQCNRQCPEWPRVDTTFGEIGMRPRSILDKALKKPIIVY